MDDQPILDAIREHAAKAADALAAIQSTDKPLTVDVITVLARRSNTDPADFWLEELKQRRLVTAFVAALRARGVALAEDVLDDPKGVIPPDRLRTFLPQAEAFQCRIRRDGAVSGSGVLVGPSLVLTSWHVIAVNGPGMPQEPAPSLEVQLSDDTWIDAKVPAAFESESAAAEYDGGRFSLLDTDLVDRHDVALLKMVQPAATHLGHVRLASPLPQPKDRSRVLLVHAPGGEGGVIDFGYTGRIKNVTARWRHTVTAESGSSGGACFDKNLQFLGVHQGEFDNVKRFVPAERFIDSIIDIVRDDVAPPTLWSLDGTVDGPLVIARTPFFRAIAVAGESGSRVRGVRIKRTAVDSGSRGLAFSHDILEQLLIRRGPEHRLVRVAQDEIVNDLAADIRRRARLRGLDVPEPPGDQANNAPGQAPADSTVMNRAQNLAAAVEAVAAKKGVTVWFYFDNPTVPLTDAARLTIESFVGAALTKPRLRVVIGGLETLTLPGKEFAGPPAAETDRSPGLIVEYIRPFTSADVRDMLTSASLDLRRGTVDNEKIQYATDRALLGLESMNGQYHPALLPTVADRLRADLHLMAKTAADVS